MITLDHVLYLFIHVEGKTLEQCNQPAILFGSPVILLSAACLNKKWDGLRQTHSSGLAGPASKRNSGLDPRSCGIGALLYIAPCACDSSRMRAESALSALARSRWIILVLEPSDSDFEWRCMVLHTGIFAIQDGGGYTDSVLTCPSGGKIERAMEIVCWVIAR